MATPLDLLRSDPLAFVALMVALIFAIALHEFAHAAAADALGDRLPRAMGRLTLNPLAHLDPLGTLLLAIAGFGWGKPVEFRPTALRSERFGAALVALAGPAMNLVLAIVGAFGYVWTLSNTGPGSPAQVFFAYFMTINVLLAVFNLIPIPPLDGSRLLTIFLPPSRRNILFFLDRYGFLILVVLLVLNGFSFLGPIIDAITRFVLTLAGYR